MNVYEKDGEKWDDYVDEHDCINVIVGAFMAKIIFMKKYILSCFLKFPKQIIITA